MADEATAGLVQRSLAGDGRAFEALVRAHLRAAYAVALAVVRVPAEAEDVAQEAFVVAYEKLHTCREPARFSGWLMHIVRNHAHNHHAQGRVRQAHAAGHQERAVTENAAANTVGVRERLLAALGHLPPRQAEVVLLHDLEGWTHGEIAQALELTETNSRQLLFTARQRLREVLADDAPRGG